MDSTLGLPLVVVLLLVALLFGVALGWLLARVRTSAQLAVGQRALDEGATARAERDALRGRLEAAQLAAATASAQLEEARARSGELARELEAERERAAQATAARAEGEQRAEVLAAQLRAREESLQQQLAERERSLEELRQTLESSKAALTDTFKSTGADVLRTTAESLLVQAREQFESQQKRGQADLEAKQRAIDETLKPFKEQLVKQEELVKQLTEKREGDAKMLGEQLRQLAELQQKAASAALSLSSAMRDNRQRGRWGEVALRNLAEMSGMSAHIDFTEQAAVEGEEGRLRPDMVVRLPGTRAIPVDAKVPMSAYLASLALEAGDATAEQRRREHVAALRTHVRALSQKRYAEALKSEVEITVLFVPVESALVAALEMDGSVYDEALQKGILITTPSTLLALLRTCALQWSQAQVAENARRIAAHASVLFDRIRLFAEHLQKVGGHLDRANQSFNQAVGSFNTRLLPAARDAAELASETGRLPDDLEATSHLPRADVQGALPPPPASLDEQGPAARPRTPRAEGRDLRALLAEGEAEGCGPRA